MSAIGFNLGFPPEIQLREATDKLLLPTCALGLEFEFERVGVPLPNQNWAAYWLSKRDASLHDAGMEFVFRRPIFGADVVAAVDGLTAYARASGYASSIRTGLHVHVDVRDIEHEQLTNMCALYALFEKAVYRYAGDNREENVFCLPWYSSHMAVLRANAVAKCSSEKLKASASAMRDEKYAGLNLDPLARFGSVEFRHLLTTTDTRRIYDWINICLSFKKYATNTVLSNNYLNLVKLMGPREFAKRVFGPLFQWLDYAEFEDDVLEFGVSTMLDVLNFQNAKQAWTAPKLTASTGEVGGFAKWAASNKPRESTPKRVPKSVIPTINLTANTTPDVAIFEDLPLTTATANEQQRRVSAHMARMRELPLTFTTVGGATTFLTVAGGGDTTIIDDPITRMEPF